MFSTRKIVALSATIGMLGITGAQAIGATAAMAKSPTLSAAASPTYCKWSLGGSRPICGHPGPNQK